jgi:hypothetical protein
MPVTSSPSRHVLSLAGVVLTTVTAVLFLVVFLADLFGLHTNPYIGIVFFLVLPALFLLGLALIPVGSWLERRRRRRGFAASPWPRIDLNDSRHRQIVLGILILTMANIVIVSLAAYRGIEYMDSVEFCGQACHRVMKPEFTAHQQGPHARVACVECHIGPGAVGFAKAKMSGTRQLLLVARGNYERPIPPPVRTLSPARETCEQCHWPEKYHGDKIRRIYEYAEDKKNTESVTTLQVRVGGGNARLGTADGIHWHMNVANQVEYIATDAGRQTIPWVRVKDRFGQVREYAVGGVTPEQLAQGERRVMDCMDCHNRPSHPIAASAERAVNEALAAGAMPKSLPFVRRETVKLLKASHPSEAAATAEISQALRNFYHSLLAAESSAPLADIEKAVQATIDIYRRNVFPEMHVTFGTYANNIGHVDFPGCFRCHDDDHKTTAGKAIGQDCETCHKRE